MTDIVLGPVLSLYSVAFYRRVARQRLGRGLAYLVYLSSLYSAAIRAPSRSSSSIDEPSVSSSCFAHRQ